MKYYANLLSTSHINRCHHLAERALQKVVRPGEVLGEFGCGSGAFMQRFSQAYAVQAMCYDISQANIANVRELGLVGEIIDFSADQYPIESASLDLALSCEVIEHLVDPKNFVKELYRVLKPGGYLCLTTPNAFNIRRRISFVFGFHADPLLDPSRSEFAEHLRAFSFSMLDRILRDQGFTVIRAIGDRIPDQLGERFRGLRSLFSSIMCFLARKQ